MVMLTTEKRPELSVIVPVFNESGNIPLLVSRLGAVLERCVTSFEIVFIDDGSSDGTFEEIRAEALRAPSIRALSLSRNFGKEIAIAAGLDAARGEAAVLIDADLQHPPEMIETFVRLWREGYDMVYGQRIDRRSESPVYRAFTRVFYRLFRNFGETGLPPGAGDFRLMNRRVIDALNRMGERARFSKGLYAWVGFRSIGVPFDVAPRAHGTTKWSFRKLSRFAFDGITSFSTVPLKVSTYAGLLVSFCAMAYALLVIGRTLLYGADVPGFPTLIVSVMFFSGIQLLSLGVIGEYIGRIFAEVKRRPLYIVSEEIAAVRQSVIDEQLTDTKTSGDQTTSQRDLMRSLYKRHAGREAEVVAAYAAAELAQQVRRKSNDHSMSAEAYAKALWADGIKKGWIT